MTGRPDGGGALGTRSRSGDRGPGGGVGVVGWYADGSTGASGGGGRARPCSHRSTSRSPTTSVDRATRSL